MHQAIHARAGLPGRIWLLGVASMLLGLVSVPGPVVAKSATVTIENFLFNPSPVTIFVGDSITWTNNDPVNSQVIPDNGGFVGSAILKPGQSYKAVFKTTGTYNYHDGFNSFMRGTVVVKTAPKASPRPTPKPTAKPTPKPTPKPTAKPATTAKAAASATPEPASSSAGTASPTAAAVAGGATQGGGNAAGGSPSGGAPAGSTGTGGVGLTEILLLLILILVAFVAGTFFRSYRRTAASQPPILNEVVRRTPMAPPPAPREMLDVEDHALPGEEDELSFLRDDDQPPGRNPRGGGRPKRPSDL